MYLFINMEIFDTIIKTKPLKIQNQQVIVGIDEAGRGPVLGN